MTENKKVTILYVDDEDINLLIFRKSFELKYAIITASSGNDALEKLNNHSNDIIVVISDMRMPSMSGIEFIRKAKVVYSNIVYFILTGFEFNDEIDDALSANLIQQFFTKPFNFKKIDDAINEVVRTLNR